MPTPSLRAASDNASEPPETNHVSAPEAHIAVQAKRDLINNVVTLRPEKITMPTDCDPKLKKLVDQFNSTLDKKPTDLTKGDGWDFVAAFMTLLAWDWDKSETNKTLALDLCIEALDFFGGKFFLETSGMSANKNHFDGFKSSLENLEYNLRMALTPPPSRNVPVEYYL